MDYAESSEILQDLPEDGKALQSHWVSWTKSPLIFSVIKVKRKIHWMNCLLLTRSYLLNIFVGM